MEFTENDVICCRNNEELQFIKEMAISQNIYIHSGIYKPRTDYTDGYYFRPYYNNWCNLSYYKP